MITGVRLIKRRWKCRFGRHCWNNCRDMRGRYFRYCFHCGADTRG